MNKKLAEYIKQMRDVDQSARINAKDSIGIHPPNILVYVVDTCNNYKIKNIIDDHGYPTKKLIGENALKDFWLLIQHQDHDAKLQKQCLKNCKFDDFENAHLTDRVLINSGNDQIYGTQLNSPVHNKEQTNIMRKKVGLPPLT